MQTFHSKKIGNSLRNVAVDVVHGENSDIISRWFHSPHEVDLVIWTDDQKRIIKAQICVFGQVTEWNAVDGTRTGVVVEQEFSEIRYQRDYGALREERVVYDRSVDERAVSEAIEVIDHTLEISAEERSRLAHSFRESSRFHHRAKGRALATWASAGADVLQVERPSFWSRVRSWFTSSANSGNVNDA
jgi:hypothetical protein